MKWEIKPLPIVIIFALSWAITSHGQTPNLNPNLVPQMAPMSTPAPIPTPVATPASSKIVLKQIDVEGRRAVAEKISGDASLDVGNQLVALLDGRDCFFVVTSVSGSVAQLDGFRCPFLDKLKVGQNLEPSLFENAPPKPTLTPAPQRQDDRLRFAISPYYGLGSTLESDNLYYNQPTQFTTYGSGNLIMNTAPGIAVEVYNTPKNTFGWSAGANYDFPRTMSGLDAYANGVYIGGSFFSPQATLSILSFYGNAIYRLDNFYFPFGLNCAIPSLQGGGNSFGNTTVTGEVGLEMGAGYIINDHVAVEFWIQNLFLDGSTTTNAGTIDYDGLSFANPQVRFRFSF